MGAGPILEAHMCRKEQILQAAGKDICLGLRTVQKGIQGMDHLEKELRISGNARCGVQIVQSEYSRIHWTDLPREAS